MWGGNPLPVMYCIWLILFCLLLLFWNQTWITRMGSPVSLASCSRISLVGFGVCEKTFFSTSSCFALMVVLGPRRLFSLLSSLPGSESFSASPLPGLLTLPLLDSSGAGPGGILGWLP